MIMAEARIDTAKAEPSVNGGNDYTVIEFLKDLKDLHNYDNVLLMHNQNTTIATKFYTNTNTMAYGNGSSTAAAGNISFIEKTLNVDASGRSTSLPFVAHLMQQVQVPVLQLNEWQHFNLKLRVPDNLLAIVQIDINGGGGGAGDGGGDGIKITLDHHAGLLQNLSKCLWRMKVAKVLFLINGPAMMNDEMLASDRGNEDVHYALVEQLFQHCWRQKLLNVAAIMANYQKTKLLYRFNPFPEFQMETVPLAIGRTQQQEEIYPQRLDNLLGYNMNVVIGGSDPRIIPYEKNGKLFVGGFVGHFVLAFAKRYNCTLQEPLPYNPKIPLPSQELMRAVRNGTVEWSSGVTFPEIPFRGYTYPYEIINFCLMIPVEADIPGYEFFTSVFKGETYVFFIVTLVIISMVLSAALFIHGYRPDLFDIICHDDCLRGMLGQSFSELRNPPGIVRAIYLEICILGILLTTTYNAYFSTYVTKAPKTAPINTLDDIMASGLKNIVWEPEYNEILSRVPEFKRYAPMFLVEPNYRKYLELRESFNTHYGYIVPTTKWTIVTEQQKIFTTPLFKQRPSFCFYNNIPMCFPIHENSLFIELMYKLMLEVSQSGLMNMWMEHGFLELIQADKLQRSDLSQKKEFEAMTVDDLLYIFIFLAVMFVFVVLVFIGEFVVFHREKVWKGL
uniref:Ionotropic glutamate receptor C-terminal domain-containing protein n=1 Tax=Musca domestica TaxID=7370 RepID=A0A1I8MBL9_MUSDO